MKFQDLANEMYKSLISQVGELSIRKSQLEQEIDFLNTRIKEIKSQLVFLDKAVPNFNELEKKNSPDKAVKRPNPDKSNNKNVSKFID